MYAEAATVVCKAGDISVTTYNGNLAPRAAAGRRAADALKLNTCKDARPSVILDVRAARPVPQFCRPAFTFVPRAAPHTATPLEQI
jgi:hypothetical protein